MLRLWDPGLAEVAFSCWSEITTPASCQVARYTNSAF